MKKNIIIFGIIILVIVLSGMLFTSSVMGKIVFEKESVLMGYCPTMENLAKEIQSKNNHVSIVPFDYTATALSALNNKKVDLVLVGRIAEKSELNDAFEIRLRDGLTLVGREKTMMLESELQNSRIHTYVGEEKAREYLLKTANIVHHDSFELAVKEGLNDIILIDWKDYSDNFELVIPVDQYRNKLEKFRMPVLYSFNKKLINNLEV